MPTKVAEIQGVLSREELASKVGGLWSSWNIQRQGWLSEKKELRNYIFATDTTTTSNSKLPWKNTTTVPKLCQIRDNLHSNYISALFPNDQWLKWEAGNELAASMDVRRAVTNYINNKLRESNTRDVVSQLLYDYIDYGVCFGEVVWEHRTHENEVSGETDTIYIGPRLTRISPLDIVFNPVATTFEESPKIVRYIKTLGDLEMDSKEYPDKPGIQEALDKIKSVRSEVGNYKGLDLDKAAGFKVDGFGTMHEYYNSGYVELLEFEGTIHNPLTGEMMVNRRITIADRSYVVKDEPIPSWNGRSYKIMAGWRKRPDNLYSMGPLDNLVGMQYRLDHLENAKADAMDLAIHPPIGVRGNVEEFVWAPGEVVDLGDDGDIIELGKNLNAVMAFNSDISILENRMEEMAGAPRQAMGIRTPGEKTAFEVQSLQNASGRIFQEKVTNFEITFFEQALNMMLELSRRNMDTSDVIRVIDDELGVEEFINITKEDLTAKGKIRAVGSRHFAAQAQLMQNLSGIFNSAVGQMVAPHTSAIAITNLLNDVMGLQKYELFKQDIAIEEQAQTQRLIAEMQAEMEEEQATPGIEGLE